MDDLQLILQASLYLGSNESPFGTAQDFNTPPMPFFVSNLKS